MRFEPGDLPAAFLQVFAGIEYRLVLGTRGDEVTTQIVASTRDTENGEVVGLGRTGSENEFARISADQCSDVASRLLDEIGGQLAEVMRARSGITDARITREAITHDIDDLRITRRRRRVIEKYRCCRQCHSRGPA